MPNVTKPEKTIQKNKLKENESKENELKENNTRHIKEAYTEHAAVPVISYKDRIFRMIFKNKKEFLALYNAMNNSDHDNPDDLTVTTLDNAIYMSMRNDVSFLLHDRLMLYEHQSTKNPNLPLRNLFCVSDIYSKLTKDMNLFGTKLLRIPEPKFIVFYTGITKAPEKEILRLSELFGNPSDETALELVTQVLNINLGYNRVLMDKCRTLHDYAIFVDTVRSFQKEMSLKPAIEMAVDKCISDNVLADFLKDNRAEVVKMGLYEYNEEQHIRLEREDAWEDGREQGLIQGQDQGRLYTLTSLIRRKCLKGKTLQIITDELELDSDDVKNIYELITQNPSIDDEWIVKKLLS